MEAAHPESRDDEELIRKSLVKLPDRGGPRKSTAVGTAPPRLWSRSGTIRPRS